MGVRTICEYGGNVTYTYDNMPPFPTVGTRVRDRRHGCAGEVVAVFDDDAMLQIVS